MRRLLIVAGWLAAALGAEEPRLVIDTGGHRSIMRDVMFIRDGKYLVSAGDDKVVRVWDVATGKTVRVIRGEIGDGDAGKIYAAALSPDERYLAVGGWLARESGSRDAVRIHDFAGGDVVALLEGHTSIIDALAFSRDGRLLASAGFDKTVRLWDVANWTTLHTLSGHRDRIFAVDLSPDGRRVVSGSDDDTLRLWDTTSGKLIREMKGHSGNVRAAVFSPDGRYIASGSDDKTVRLWDGETGEPIKKLGEQNRQIVSLAFSPDARRLVTGIGSTGAGGYDSAVFAVPSGEVVSRFSEHDNSVAATAISPDGHIAATGGGDIFPIYLWDIESGDAVRSLAGEGRRVWSVAFANDGGSITFGNESSYRSLNNRGPLRRVITLRQDGAYRVALGGEVRDESRFLRADGVHGGLSLKTRKGPAGRDKYLQIVRGDEIVREIARDRTSGYRHNCFSFTPDGNRIVSGASNGVLTSYSVESGEKAHDFVGHTSEVWAVAISPDGKTLVSGSADQTVRLWDMETSNNLLTVFVGADEE